jgi:hypothetical protein
MGSQLYLEGSHAPVPLDWNGLSNVRKVPGAVEDRVIMSTPTEIVRTTFVSYLVHVLIS